MGDQDRPAVPSEAEVEAAVGAGDHRDPHVPWRVFAGVGVILAGLAIVYGGVSDEAAGIVMLFVATGLAVFCGVFLWRAERRLQRHDGAPPVDPAAGPEGLSFLPESSPWPFGIGLGATLILNGLIIGQWFLVPGVMLIAVSLAGFARQSRHRYRR